MTKEEKYIKQMKEYLSKYFTTFELKLVNYVEPCGYTIGENGLIIKTKNAGFVHVSFDLATSMRPFGYCVYTQKYAYEFFDASEYTFTFAHDERFKKNNCLCQKSVDTIKNFILSEYEPDLS